MWLWWQLVSKNADSKFIDNWQLYRGDVDWNSKVLTNSVKTINEWLDKGFISRNATGMKAEDTTQAFIKANIRSTRLVLGTRAVSSSRSSRSIGTRPSCRNPTTQSAAQATCW